jgi:predicted metal-dependent hydrolase
VNAEALGELDPTRGVGYLNPELVLAPASCADHVVTHELRHLVHAPHRRKFYELLRPVMPEWEERKAKLDRVAAEPGSEATACGAGDSRKEATRQR